MSFWKKVFIATLLMVFSVQNASAVVDFNQQKDKRGVVATGFTDFPPFGETFYKETRHGTEVDYYDNLIFSTFIDEFLQNLNMTVQYQYQDKNYADSVRQVRAGNIDIIMGMYYGTKLYDGLDYIIPAVFNNPVTVIMLPSRINEIKSTSDLQKLKGGILEREHLSDYVVVEMKNYNLKKVKEPYELFRMLFSGEIDYIFASYYTGVIESSRLGLRNKVSFSKQAIWDMPVFIGVSKVSQHRNFLVNRLTKYIDDKANLDRLKQKINEKVQRQEAEGLQVVPPVFVKE